MKSPLIRAAGFCLIISASYTAHSATSQSEDLERLYGDEDFVSIATGTKQPINKAPAVASVITADDIKAMGATNLDEALESVPGLHVATSSLWFGPIYSIRGIYTDINPQVLVLINGVPITQVYTGDRGARSTLPVEDISRIEVIRGPGSAVYGADAFAGVINVITKDAKEINGTQVGTRIGSFNTQQGWLLHGGTWAGFDVAFSLEWQHTAGDDNRIIDADQQTAFDNALGTNASLAPGPANTGQRRLDTRLDISRDQWRFRIWNWRQYGVGTGPGIALALDPAGSGNSDNYLSDLTYHNPRLTNNWDFTSQLAYMDINSMSREVLFPPGTVLPIDSNGNVNPVTPANFVLFPDGLIGTPSPQEKHGRLDLTGIYSGFNKHKVRLASGINWAKLDATESKNFGPGVIDGTQPVVNGDLTNVTDTPYVFVKPHERTVYYASLQDEWSFARDWDLTAGVRYDHYSDFGSTINPRAALVWQTRYDLTTKLLYGRAFRAPSFAELFSINNPIRLGNPNLSPEKIDTVELAFIHQPTFNIQTSLNIFRYWIHDLILLTPAQGGTVFDHQNAGEQNGYGLEWELDWKFNDNLKLTTNYSYQYSENTKTHSDAGNAPHHQVYTRLNWKFLPSWSLVPQLDWVIDRKRVAGDTRPNPKNYAIVDLTLRRTALADHWELAFLIKNLFDANAVEPSPYSAAGAAVPNDFPLPGRSFYGEVRYNF